MRARVLSMHCWSSGTRNGPGNGFIRLDTSNMAEPQSFNWLLTLSNNTLLLVAYQLSIRFCSVQFAPLLFMALHDHNRGRMQLKLEEYVAICFVSGSGGMESCVAWVGPYQYHLLPCSVTFCHAYIRHSLAASYLASNALLLLLTRLSFFERMLQCALSVSDNACNTFQEVSRSVECNSTKLLPTSA